MDKMKENAEVVWRTDSSSMGRCLKDHAIDGYRMNITLWGLTIHMQRDSA